MTIEQELRNIVKELTAIQKVFSTLVKDGEAKKASPKKTKPKTEPKIESKTDTAQPMDTKVIESPFTETDVRNALVEVMQKIGEAEAKTLLFTVGNAPAISVMKPENYEPLINACKEATSGKS